MHMSEKFQIRAKILLQRLQEALADAEEMDREFGGLDGLVEPISRALHDVKDFINNATFAILAEEFPLCYCGRSATVKVFATNGHYDITANLCDYCRSNLDFPQGWDVYEEVILRCALCGAIISPDEAWETDDGTPHCADCYAKLEAKYCDGDTGDIDE